MKKIILLTLTILIVISSALVLNGCDTEAQRVNYNVTEQAENFNVISSPYCD